MRRHVRSACWTRFLAALECAHARGLVHRDVKPSNILLWSGGRREYAKVADFGVAKILGAEHNRTATAAKMGTLAYMSPEHVRTPKRVDARSDVYSVGVLFFEMLTGRPPFEADSEYELMRQIVERPLDRDARSSFPASLWSILEKALEKDPGRRFQNCDEMSSSLGEAVRGQALPVVAASPVALWLFRRPCRHAGHAEAEVEHLRRRGFPAELRGRVSGGRPLFTVAIGPLSNATQREAIRARLKLEEGLEVSDEDRADAP